MTRWLAILALLGSLAVPAAALDVRRVEVVGAVPAGPDAPSGQPLRQAALQAALVEAVDRVARGLLAEGGSAPDPEMDLSATLGDEPAAYTVRYRILEDRGERRALLVEEPGVATEAMMDQTLEARTNCDLE